MKEGLVSQKENGIKGLRLGGQGVLDLFFFVEGHNHGLDMPWPDHGLITGP